MHERPNPELLFYMFHNYVPYQMIIHCYQVTLGARKFMGEGGEGWPAAKRRIFFGIIHKYGGVPRPLEDAMPCPSGFLGEMYQDEVTLMAGYANLLLWLVAYMT